MGTDVAFVDDGRWLPLDVRESYKKLGGADFVFQKVASGKSLIEIEKEFGIPARSILMFSKVDQSFAMALDEAMDVRSVHTSESIQGLANRFDDMAAAQDKAMENNDLERLMVLQNLHEGQRKLLKDKSELLKYMDIKNRADKAANKVIAGFDDIINDISDAEIKDRNERS